MAEWNWDWTKNQPPPPLSLFGLLPGMRSLEEASIPGASAAPPVLPDVAKNRPPVLTGPGFNPAVVGNPKGTALQPGLLNFGTTTPAGTPAETEAEAKARILKSYLENKDFMGGLAMLAKGTGLGGGKAPAPPPRMHMGDLRMGSGLPSHGQAAGAAMQQALAKMAGDEWDLTAPPTRKRKRGHQDRYDILRGQ